MVVKIVDVVENVSVTALFVVITVTWRVAGLGYFFVIEWNTKKQIRSLHTVTSFVAV